MAIASRKPEHLGPAAEQLRAGGAQVSAVEVNVREPESVARMVERVGNERGRIDILVNNAAGNFYAPSATLSPNGWRAVVETDLYGTFFCCQAVYPLMKAQGAGRIVSISMTLHYRGWPLMAHATAAKAGVDALTRTLALEWAKDRITVNAALAHRRKRALIKERQFKDPLDEFLGDDRHAGAVRPWSAAPPSP